MARLNEPPGESVESLKRRFIRQNRELARCNSIQSVKIRNLENDVSHLLSENATLRQQTIQCHLRLQASNNQDVRKGIASMKTQLESKVTEIGSLLEQLGGLTKQPERRRSSTSKLSASPKRSPNRKVWRNNSSLGEVLASQEGRLPTITEGKNYPRNTLGPTDLQRILSDTGSDSPNLGSPPKTYFERNNAGTSEGASQDTEDLPAFSSVNLESRRRRRETQVRPDDLDCDDLEGRIQIERSKPSSTRPTQVSGQPLRAGAKRKLETRDANSQKPTSSDIQKAVNNDENQTGTISPQKHRPANREPASPHRRVLGSKPVNTDPSVSPRKAPTSKRAPLESDVKPAKPTRPARPSSRSSLRETEQSTATSTGSHPPTRSYDVVSTVEIPAPAVEIKTEPQTPHDLDLFSPDSTGLESEPKRGGTPPPSDLASQGRGGRRARAAVSYAEPKLNVKMRRPTKDLIDAVGVKKEENDRERSRSVTLLPDDEAHGSRSEEEEGRQVYRTIHLKREEGSNGPRSWQENARPEPTSPLRDKTEGTTSHQNTQRHEAPNDAPSLPFKPRGPERRRSTAHPDMSNRDNTQSAPINPSSRPEDPLDIFDVEDSPPHSADTLPAPNPSTAPPPRPNTSTSRRTSTSSISSDLGRSTSTSNINPATAAKLTPAAVAALRRRQTLSACSTATGAANAGTTAGRSASRAPATSRVAASGTSRGSRPSSTFASENAAGGVGRARSVTSRPGSATGSRARVARESEDAAAKSDDEGKNDYSAGPSGSLRRRRSMMV